MWRFDRDFQFPLGKKLSFGKIVGVTDDKKFASDDHLVDIQRVSVNSIDQLPSFMIPNRQELRISARKQDIEIGMNLQASNSAELSGPVSKLLAFFKF